MDQIFQTEYGNSYHLLTAPVKDYPEITTILKATNKSSEHIVIAGGFALAFLTRHSEKLLGSKCKQINFGDVDIYFTPEGAMDRRQWRSHSLMRVLGPTEKGSSLYLYIPQGGFSPPVETQIQYIIENPAAEILLAPLGRLAIHCIEPESVQQTIELYKSELILPAPEQFQAQKERAIDVLQAYDLAITQVALWVNNETLSILYSDECYINLLLKYIAPTQRHEGLLKAIRHNTLAKDRTVSLGHKGRLIRHVLITAQRLQKYAIRTGYNVNPDFLQLYHDIIDYGWEHQIVDYQQDDTNPKGKQPYVGARYISNELAAFLGLQLRHEQHETYTYDDSPTSGPFPTLIAIAGGSNVSDQSPW